MLTQLLRPHAVIRAFVLAALLCVPGVGEAQTGQTAQIPLQFDFLTPGARSLGMASAFVAVADDATAAFTNPAGLTFLTKPEVSVEGRARRLVTPFLSGGRLSGNTTGLGDDTTAGPVYQDSVDSSTRPYYASVVYPWKKLSFAAYRHELVSQNNAFQSTGPFLSQVFAAGSLDSRQFALRGNRSISVDNYGASAAYRVSPNFSVGAGVSAFRFKMDALFSAYGRSGSLFAPTDFTNASATAKQTGKSTQLSFNAGALITVQPAVRVGLVFRQGTDFDFSQFDDVRGLPESYRIGLFRVPTVVGAGVRVQPSDRWSFAIDYDHVQYSRLKSDYIDFQVDETYLSRVSIPDGDEIHIGGEYTLVTMPKTPSIRAGLWFDPKHAVAYNSDGSGSAADQLLKAAFPGGENLWHYTVGFGLPISPALEFNVGADLSKARRYVSFSLVARFGK
jgi:long-subunit fatty acid transport protein